MAIANHILEEELENLLRQQRRIAIEMEGLPRGTIVMKMTKVKQYPYLQYKQNGLVISSLVKKDQNVAELQILLQKRKDLAKKLKEIQAEVRLLELALRSLSKRSINEQ